MSTNLKSKKVIDNLDELIRRISELEKVINKNEDYYLFRGQANSEWELNSTWRRQWEAPKYCKNCKYCKKHKTNNEINDNKKLKTDAIINGFNKMKELMEKWGYKKVNDIEMLCEIQHSNDINAPTFLIDFTSNIYHALWFAVCDGTINEINTNAKIFILKYDESLLRYDMNFENLMYEGMSNIYALAPLNITHRSNAQKSFFIFDQQNIEGNFDIESWEISLKIKEEILNYLKKKNITAKSIYPDLLGSYKDTFAHVQKEMKRKLNNIDKLFENYNSYTKKIKNRKKYKEISDLTKNINILNKEYQKIKDPYLKIFWKGKTLLAQLYNKRGVLYLKSNEIYKSISNFNHSIKISLNKDKEAYYNRGNAYNRQYELNKAIEDYTKAIEIDDTYEEAYYERAWLYIKKNEFNNVIQDCTRIINDLNNNNINVYILRVYGYCLAKEYDKAMTDCTKGLQIDPNNIPLLDMKKILNQYKRIKKQK